MGSTSSLEQADEAQASMLTEVAEDAEMPLAPEATEGEAHRSPVRASPGSNATGIETPAATLPRIRAHLLLAASSHPSRC